MGYNGISLNQIDMSEMNKHIDQKIKNYLCGHEDMTSQLFNIIETQKQLIIELKNIIDSKE